MKLELKHLAPYLPYGLQINQHREDININWQSELVSLSADQLKVMSRKFPYIENLAYYEAKPILHPLSDLTKEIEVDGKWFVPLIELSKIAFHKIPTRCLSGNYVEMGHAYSFHFYNNNSDGVSFSCKRGYNGATWDYECYVPNQLELFQKLFEWHFDVFGLIKEGLAININTLEP